MCIKSLNALTKLIFISCFILNIVQLPASAEITCSYCFGTGMSKALSASRTCDVRKLNYNSVPSFGYHSMSIFKNVLIYHFPIRMRGKGAGFLLDSCSFKCRLSLNLRIVAGKPVWFAFSELQKKSFHYFTLSVLVCFGMKGHGELVNLDSTLPPKLQYKQMHLKEICCLNPLLFLVEMKISE